MPPSSSPSQDNTEEWNLVKLQTKYSDEEWTKGTYQKLEDKTSKIKFACIVPRVKLKEGRKIAQIRKCACMTLVFTSLKDMNCLIGFDLYELPYLTPESVEALQSNEIIRQDVLKFINYKLLLLYAINGQGPLSIQDIVDRIEELFPGIETLAKECLSTIAKSILCHSSQVIRLIISTNKITIDDVLYRGSTPKDAMMFALLDPRKLDMLFTATKHLLDSPLSRPLPYSDFYYFEMAIICLLSQRDLIATIKQIEKHSFQLFPGLASEREKPPAKWLKMFIQGISLRKIAPSFSDGQRAPSLNKKELYFADTPPSMTASVSLGDVSKSLTFAVMAEREVIKGRKRLRDSLGEHSISKKSNHIVGEWQLEKLDVDTSSVHQGEWTKGTYQMLVDANSSIKFACIVPRIKLKEGRTSIKSNNDKCMTLVFSALEDMNSLLGSHHYKLPYFTPQCVEALQSNEFIRQNVFKVLTTKLLTLFAMSGQGPLSIQDTVDRIEELFPGIEPPGKGSLSTIVQSKLCHSSQIVRFIVPTKNRSILDVLCRGSNAKDTRLYTLLDPRKLDILFDAIKDLPASPPSRILSSLDLFSYEIIILTLLSQRDFSGTFAEIEERTVELFPGLAANREKRSSRWRTDFKSAILSRTADNSYSSTSYKYVCCPDFKFFTYTLPSSERPRFTLNVLK